MAKHYYPLTTRFRGDDPVFLNMGYEEDPPMALPLEASDDPNRSCIQLYHRTATQVDLTDKPVLEVSCGHGGGASYLVRTLHPASYTGLDLNRAGIDFCRKKHQMPGLDFVCGNAENLPFADQSFDAVINIEAACYYLRFPRSSPRRPACCAREAISCTLTSAHTTKSPTGRRKLGNSPMRLMSERVISEQGCARAGDEAADEGIESALSSRVSSLVLGR